MNKKKEFASNISREQIQRELDLQIFTDKTNTEIVLQYLENPHNLISTKYK